MHVIHRIIVGLGIAVIASCFGLIILFNWSVTGWKALTVPTGSMRPNINPGELVLVHSVPYSSLKVGDVITYASPLERGRTISHRIIKAYKINGIVPGFVTKGDANPTADKPIVGGQVQGKVLWGVPHVGEWLSWTHTIIGVLVIVYVPALIIMFEEMKRLITYYKKYMPYKSAVVLSREKALRKPFSKFGTAAVLSVLFVAGSAFVSLPAFALLRSNKVALINNRITVKKAPGGGNHTCSSNNDIDISNTTDQTASTGNANSSNNTTSANATTGDATNNNNSNFKVVIKNC